MVNSVAWLSRYGAFVALALSSSGMSRSCASASSTCGCDSSDNAFDYMLLVEQWPGAWEKTNPTHFTLHGLWPSRVGSDECSYPCTCTNERFDEGAISSIMEDMKEYWPSLEGSGNEGFWSHEWGKHGTCAEVSSSSGSKQLDYFSLALNWLKKTNVSVALEKAGIVPGASYDASAIQDALYTANGVKGLLGCKSGNSLDSVSFCLDPTASRLVDCDESVAQGGGSVSSCRSSSKIYFSDASGGAPTAPPSPGGDKCSRGKRGPACRQDADCSSVSGCIRCAHSGYCTDVPLTFSDGKGTPSSAVSALEAKATALRVVLPAAAVAPLL